MVNDTLLDDILLRHVFQPRYMSMDLCVRLEHVSKLFSNNADLFYRQLERVDVKHFLARESNVNWARKIYHRSPYLKHVENMPINDDDCSKLTIISSGLVCKMRNVTSLTLDMKSRSPVSMLMLRDMLNLDTVTIILDDDDNHDSFNDLKPIEKLRVKSLKCNQLFWPDSAILATWKFLNCLCIVNQWSTGPEFFTGPGPGRARAFDTGPGPGPGPIDIKNITCYYMA